MKPNWPIIFCWPTYLYCQAKRKVLALYLLKRLLAGYLLYAVMRMAVPMRSGTANWAQPLMWTTLTNWQKQLRDI